MLGDVLRTRHPRWPNSIGVEQTGVLEEAPGKHPDIVVRHPDGLPVVVETEFAPARTVEGDACDRLGHTLLQDGRTIEQSIAVRIPAALSTAPQYELERLLEDAALEFCVFSGNPETPDRWPNTGWVKGHIDDLAAFIEHAALSEDRIARGMLILEEGIGQAATLLREACANAPDTLEAIARELHQKDSEQTSRMAMAILANALTFHTAIAGSLGVETVDQSRGIGHRLSKSRILKAWHHILTDINYWPIFRIASDILLPIRNGTAQRILDRLARVANELDALGATSQHDLCGRMFQRLITDRKFLATFYTLPSSAALLAELAVSRLNVDWSDAEAVCALRIADFACGTGALLNAAYSAVLARHRRTAGDDRAIHSRMMESALVGADIMPAASHLTATVLSSAHPNIPFQNTSIATLPYGEQPEELGRDIALGALDLIERKTIPSLFGTGDRRVRGVESGGSSVDLPHGSCDLVIMNPPFTRPTGQEAEKIGIPVPSFAGFATSKTEQREMSRKLGRLRKPGMAGHGNAGLASNFIDVAHAKVKSGGVLALVLPAAFVQGKSWAAARQLLRSHYRDIAIVSIAATGSTDRAFSADTGMAEALVVATRREGNGPGHDSVSFLNLLQRPVSVLEAVTVGRVVWQSSSDQDVGPVALGTDQNVGCRIRASLSETGCAGLRDTTVAKTGLGLAHGELHLPRTHSSHRLPLVHLDALGRRGLYHMDLSGTETVSDGLPRGSFDIANIGSGEVPTWPALWSHAATRETRMIVEPDSQGLARPDCEERAVLAWDKTASRLHFNRDFRINSQPLAACMTPEESIGGRAWPNFLCTSRRWEKSLVLWANTTPGLIAFWWIGTRQQQGRAILTLSRLPALTVLDARQLSSAQIDRADAMFENFAARDFLPANEAWRDSTRQALDRAVLIDLLGLPNDILEPLDLLRRQWCAEPSVHGGKETAPVPARP